jgi:hypothetical protein
VRMIFSLFGLIVYMNRTLHVPMHHFRSQMLIFGSVCRAILTGEIKLDCAIGVVLSARDIRALLELGSVASKWPVASFARLSRLNNDVVDVYTEDASKIGGAAVIISSCGIHIHSWRWPSFASEFSINALELLAIDTGVKESFRIVRSRCNPSINLFTDSLVALWALKSGWSRSATTKQCSREHPTLPGAFVRCARVQLCKPG